MATSVIKSPSPHQQQLVEASQTDWAAPSWRPLYWVAGVVALLSGAIIPVAVVVFLSWPPPTTIESWFALFQRNGFLGLLDLDLLLVTSYVVMIPLYLAVYVALRGISPSLMALALAFNLVGTVLSIAMNPGVAMLTLSGRYASAATAADKATYLAAGQALIANWSGTAYFVGYLLGGIGILITAAVMLRSQIFSKAIAYTGLVMGLLMLLPASVGTVGLLVSLLSLVPTVVWLILIARRFFQLGQGLAPKAAARQ